MGLMCGRFAATTDPALLALKIDALDETGDPGDRAAGYRVQNYRVQNFNVAPTSTIAAVVSRHTEPDDLPTRRVRLMRWGLIPPWTKTEAAVKGPLLINARAERVTTAPAFRASATSRRCLIPMDGYYEWRVNDAGASPHKTPFFMYRDDGEPLFVAGLWSAWRPHQDAPPVLSCAIITTDAAGELGAIHDRMPLVVPDADWGRWLNPDAPADEGLLERPPDVRGIRTREVSTRVNNVRNNGPDLIAPAEPQPEQGRLL